MNARITSSAFFPARLAAAALLASTLAACNDGNSPPPPAPTPPAPAPVALSCDDTMKTAFKPDANTAVTLVKAFKAGDALALSGTPASPTPPVAAADLCLVKLVIGPGNAGPASAPSTSAGIGVELWLPTAANWNQRLHVLGGGGWAGGTAISSTTVIGAAAAAAVAGSEGAVSAMTDTGHTGTNGSFTMNPDGSINAALWTDFSSRAIHEMTVKAKALISAYYLKAQKYAYWDGCSTGGRQGHMEAQANPTDYDGILAGAPAFNWSRFITSELYPQVVMQRDLAGATLTKAQRDLVSSAAVSACDNTLNGQHDGFISDFGSCRYDPTKDSSVLCSASGGSNGTAACVSSTQAAAIGKFWYGQTADGSWQDPALDNGYGSSLSPSQLWFGITRGTQLDLLAGGAGEPPFFGPFPIASDQVAINLQDPTIATPAFTNAVANGANGWKNLGYQDLANATAQGIALQSFFGSINTDNPDLRAFRDHGGKMLMYHGLNDPLIVPQGSINYYTRASNVSGGFVATQSFYRLFLVPGMGHCAGLGAVNGTAGVSPAANPPLPATGQMFKALTDWVENGTAPNTITVSNTGATISRPLCMYPKKIAYVGGDVNAAASYTCQ